MQGQQSTTLQSHIVRESWEPPPAQFASMQAESVGPKGSATSCVPARTKRYSRHTSTTNPSPSIWCVGQNHKAKQHHSTYTGKSFLKSQGSPCESVPHTPFNPVAMLQRPNLKVRGSRKHLTPQPHHCVHSRIPHPPTYTRLRNNALRLGATPTNLPCYPPKQSTCTQHPTNQSAPAAQQPEPFPLPFCSSRWCCCSCVCGSRSFVTKPAAATCPSDLSLAISRAPTCSHSGRWVNRNLTATTLPAADGRRTLLPPPSRRCRCWRLPSPLLSPLAQSEDPPSLSEACEEAPPCRRAAAARMLAVSPQCCCCW